MYTTIAAAIAAAPDGATIQVQSGTYTDDTATITHNITLKSVGGMVTMHASQPLANGKGILIIGTATASPTVTITGFEFSGATSTSGSNGAGIRYQSGNLTLTHSYLHDNQDGLLATPFTVNSGSISIDSTEFANNGIGDGLTHNLYIGEIASLTVTNSYSHDANAGHELKSLAFSNTITTSRFYDNNSTASYSIEVDQNAVSSINNNVIEQGANTQNPAIIHFSTQVGLQPGASLTISNNTVVNDLTSPSANFVFNSSSLPVTLKDNSIWGLTSGQLATYGSGAGTVSDTGTVYLGSRPTLDTSHPY
jgi:hypothetical protein